MSVIKVNKITFVGDIICDKEMLKAGKIGKNSYNFDEMFLPLKDYFKDSSYVIGNLETVISNRNYTDSVFSFCNPEELVKSLKDIGINALSLANNHVLDRGEDGIKSTIKYLKKYNIKYFGVNNKNLYIKLKNAKICVLSYTDSTNYHVNKCNNFNCVNLLKPPNMSIPRKKKNFFSRMYHKLSPNIRININNLLKKKIKPIIDRCGKYDELDEYIKPLKRNIKEQKNNGYYTVMYSHMGGQFNVAVGEYSLKMANKFKEFGVDSLISTHPHIIQKMEKKDNCFCFYSI